MREFSGNSLTFRGKRLKLARHQREVSTSSSNFSGLGMTAMATASSQAAHANPVW